MFMKSFLKSKTSYIKVYYSCTVVLLNAVVQCLDVLMTCEKPVFSIINTFFFRNKKNH